MYNKVLTIILIILLIAIIVTVGFLVKGYWDEYTLNKDAQLFLEEFDTIVVNLAQENVNEELEKNENIVNNSSGNNSSNNTSNNKIALTYKGFKVVGKLEMPTINIRYPILGESEKAKTLEVSVVKIYGPEINQPGNVVIAGHNYNNSLFFGKNKNLKIGDKIYITDMQGNRVEYTIYNKYYAPEGENSYMTRDTQGKKEVTLYTCDATGANRLIVCARADY